MKPEDIIKYVFATEQQDYQARALKCRKSDLVQARQRSIYLIKHFHPYLLWREVAEMFDLDHASAIHAYNKVTNYISTEKRYNDDMSRYILIIRNSTKIPALRVNCVSATYRMTNKRAILRKTALGYEIKLKRLNERTIETATLNLSAEAMAGIVEAYKTLTK